MWRKKHAVLPQIYLSESLANSDIPAIELSHKERVRSNTVVRQYRLGPLEAIRPDVVLSSAVYEEGRPKAKPPRWDLQKSNS